jgi:hypothetical protein
LKWRNKGHEFDEIGAIFQKNKKLLLVGTDEETTPLRKKLAFLGADVSTSSFFPPLEKKRGFGNILRTLKSVYSRHAIPRQSGQTVLVSKSSESWIDEFCSRGGFKRNETIFPAQEFFQRHLPCFAAYAHDKAYSYHGTCVVVTTCCSLNCKYCLNYEPYIENKKNMDLASLKKDIDLFFSCHDKVEHFSLTGGEPFLHPGLTELMLYINDNYRERMEIFGTATNGTIVPSDELCKVIKDCGIQLICDDYTKTAPSSKQSRDELTRKCKAFGIDYIDGQNPRFFITFPPREEIAGYDQSRMIDRFHQCKDCYSGFGLKDGRLYSCCYSMFAETAKLVDAVESDYYELSRFTPTSQARKELMEFRAGYSENGFAHFCNYCNGFPSINDAFDENGATQQPKGELLRWDGKKMPIPNQTSASPPIEPSGK